MCENWVGSIVSLDCGEMGTYQGQVRMIENSTQTLILRDIFLNGLKVELPEVNIRAQDIKELKILKDPAEAKAIVDRRSTPSKLMRELEPAAKPACGSPVEVVKPKSYSPPHFNQQNGRAGRNGYTRLTPTGQGEDRSSLTPTRDVNGKSGRNSAPNSRPRKVSTPRKIEGGQNNRRAKDDAFTDPVSSYQKEDFDFETNLALFDKKSVYEEIENSQPVVVRAGEKKPTKYRHDENVLHTQQPVLQQIKVPCTSTLSYVTDSGLVVPTVTPDLLARLLAQGERYGFTEERRVEMVGRSACEMVLTLLGGAHRLHPQNKHQLPRVLVLCGPHLQGAQGLNCARHLANHGVKTRVFVPNFVRMHASLERELQLYDLTEGSKTSSPKDLTLGETDLVVLALENHENSVLRGQNWFQEVASRATSLRAPVLAIEPPLEGAALPTKWCLAIGLPLPFKPSNTQVFLCDLGLPPRVFAEVGVKYVSPFSHKFVIPLHASK